MEELRAKVAELNGILLVHAEEPTRVWVQQVLTEFGGRDARDVDRQLRSTDVSTAVGLILKDWDRLARRNAEVLSSGLREGLFAIQKVRNRVAHFNRDDYSSADRLLADAALTKNFLTTIGASESLIQATDLLIRSIVNGERKPVRKPRSRHHESQKQQSATVLVGAHAIIHAESVRELYERLLEYLLNNGYAPLMKSHMPYRTSSQRYLVSSTPVHPSGRPFWNQVERDGFFLEAHKDYKNAISHMQGFAARLGLPLKDVTGANE